MRTFVPAVLAISLGGCATFVHGPYQDVRIDSNPPGATATIYPQQSQRGPLFLNEEQIKLTTPTTIRLHRDTNYRVEFQKTGFVIGEKKIVSHYDWLLGSSLCWPCEAIGASPVPWIAFPVSAARPIGQALRILNPDAVMGNAFKLKAEDDGFAQNWTGWGTPTVSVDLAPVH
jgi:hypothetical protein